MAAETNYEGHITLGPWGGSKGKSWIYKPKGFIKKISILHGEVIDCIKFKSVSSTGEAVRSFFGGRGGKYTDKIYIDYPKEYLVSISGTYGIYGESLVVTSLQFHTNQYRYGPYGSDTGTRFSYNGIGGVIVGFHGCADKYLDAVGTYVISKSLVLGRNSTSEDNSKHELCSSLSRMAIPRNAGPWGASGGKPWDDGVFSAIKQVRVHVGESWKQIYAIQFEYVKRDAKSVLSEMHGGTCGDKTELVNLDGTNEYLTGISGFYGPVEGYNGLEAIMSITFHTNKTIHGPYGEESGAGYVYFTSTVCPGKVVGFHGRNDGFLRAIGVHVEYF